MDSMRRKGEKKQRGLRAQGWENGHGHFMSLQGPGQGEASNWQWPGEGLGNTALGEGWGWGRLESLQWATQGD